jgi:hypothetical protein
VMVSWGTLSSVVIVVVVVVVAVVGGGGGGSGIVEVGGGSRVEGGDEMPTIDSSLIEDIICMLGFELPLLKRRDQRKSAVREGFDISMC